MKAEKKGRIAEIVPEGDLRENMSRDFVETIRALISQDTKRFSIDFRKTGFIDSYSIANLIIFCDRPELDFTFKNADRVMRFFDITGFKTKVLFE